MSWRYIFSNAALAAFFMVFLAANVTGFLQEPRLSVLLLIAFQSTVVTLSIIRRDVERVDPRAVVFIAGWAGTLLPLWLRPDSAGGDVLVGQVLQVGGLAMQLLAVISLGRSFGVVAADRGIKTGGAYRLVRHPIYAAYLLGDAGFLVSHPSASNIAAVALALGAQIVRIRFEEQHLMQNHEYVEFAQHHRWRLVPGIW